LPDPRKSQLELSACPYKSNKGANLISKIVRMGHESELSEDFLLMPNDHLLLQDCEASDF